MITIWLLGMPALCCLWLGVLVARPMRPVGMDVDLWLIYSRLRGGWERLRLFGIMALMVWFVIAIIAGTSAISRELATERNPCQRAMRYLAENEATVPRDAIRGLWNDGYCT